MNTPWYKKLLCSFLGHIPITEVDTETASLTEPGYEYLPRNVTILVGKTNCKRCKKLLDIQLGGVLKDPAR